MRPKIKICGFMNEADIDICLEIGAADILGFVTDYPLNVPWNLSKDRTLELLKYTRNKSDIECAMVTGGEIKKLIFLIDVIKPDYIQLHYKENTKIITQVKEYSSIKIIKTVPNNLEDCILQSGENSIEECAKKFEQAGADILLVDSRQPSNVTEKSKFLDKNFFAKVKNSVKIPVMAAGGINPDNIKYVCDKLMPDYIDIMTGVEISPGHKSKILLEKLKNRTNNYSQLLQQDYPIAR